MLRRNDRNLDNIPVGALGIIALDGCKEMGGKVNNTLSNGGKRMDMPTRMTSFSTVMNGIHF